MFAYTVCHLCCIHRPTRWNHCRTTEIDPLLYYSISTKIGPVPNAVSHTHTLRQWSICVACRCFFSCSRIISPKWHLPIWPRKHIFGNESTCRNRNNLTSHARIHVNEHVIDCYWLHFLATTTKSSNGSRVICFLFVSIPTDCSAFELIFLNKNNNHLVWIYE